MEVTVVPMPLYSCQMLLLEYSSVTIKLLFYFFDVSVTREEPRERAPYLSIIICSQSRCDPRGFKLEPRVTFSFFGDFCVVKINMITRPSRSNINALGIMEPAASQIINCTIPIFFFFPLPLILTFGVYNNVPRVMVRRW